MHEVSQENPVALAEENDSVASILRVIKLYVETESEVRLSEGWERRNFEENGIDSLLFMQLLIALEDHVKGLFSDAQMRMDCYENMEDLARQASELNRA